MNLNYTWKNKIITYKKTFILLILSLLILGGYISYVYLTRTTKVVVTCEDFFVETYIFEIKSNGIIEVKLCERNISNSNILSKNYIHEIIKTEKIVLSDVNRTSINKLIKQVTKSKSRPNKINIPPSTGVWDVNAFINGKLYWCRYTSDYERTKADQKYINKDLLNLVYKLVEVSPKIWSSDGTLEWVE